VQILYWMGEYKKALALCEITLIKNPNPYLKLDYARLLFELNELSKAREVLEDYLKTDKTNSEAINMMGTIFYWQGKPGVAIRYFESVLDKYPGNEWALKYVNEIKENTSPFIHLNSIYSDDTQPLQTAGISIETGKYFSFLLDPKLKIQFNQFSNTLEKEHAYSIVLNNNISILKIKTDILVSAGAYRSPIGNSTNLIGGIKLNKHIFKYFTFSGLVERKPYLLTLRSLNKNILSNNYSGSLIYFKETSWNGQIEYAIQEFPDNNKVNNFNAWLLSPQIRFSKFAIALGYGFSLSDSEQNRFSPVNSISEIISGIDMIEGVYDPYFTPRNQHIHSAICNLSIDISKSFTISTNTVYGFYATTDNPYFYLDKNSNGELFINREFANLKFEPMEIAGRINWKLSKRFNLHALYSHLKTFYYTNNSIELGLKYKFIREYRYR
jgi:tetratricopeptide (TPR) repeat protein